MRNTLYGTSPINHAIDTGADALVRQANDALPADVLRQLGTVVAKGGMFTCPVCKGHEPHATFRDERGDYVRRWRCTADGCGAGGSVVDLVALVRGLSQANAARWILGEPAIVEEPLVVEADDGKDDAGDFYTSTKATNAVENEVPAFVGSETRAEKVFMNEYSPNGADGPRASSGSADSIFERAKAVPIADVLSRLQIETKGHKFKCPAHDDDNPSADFRDSSTGKAHSRWQCFACGAGGSGVDLVIHAKGLDKADAARWITGEPSPVKNGHAANGKPVSKPGEHAKARKPRVYRTENEVIDALLRAVRTDNGENWNVAGGGWKPYRNAAGEIVLGVVRFEDGTGEKTFRQFSRHDDGWIAKGMPSGIPPFNLPELDQNKPLVVVEGEKACAAAWEIGLQSTTWAGGSNAVKKTDWSLLAGFDVIVWPDADEPGRKAAADVAKALHGVAARVRVLPDDPDAAEGDDAADTLAAMGQEKAMEYFHNRLERAIDWAPAEPAVVESARLTQSTLPQVVFPISYNDPSRIFAKIIPHLADAGVYYRDGSLCRIVRGDSVKVRGVGKLGISGPAIDTHDADSILPVLCRAIDFQAERKTKEGYENFPAPPRAAFLRWFLRLRDWPGTPYLAGIASGPFLRHDGTVCTTPGYDAASGWYLDYQGEPIEVPEHPTRAEAEAACRELLALVDQFEWKCDSQRAGWLAYLLTLVARPGIEGNVPAFVFTASTKGAGKTLQVNVANIIVHGHPASGYSPPQGRSENESAEEWRKMLFAYALSGNPSLVVSNCPSGTPLGNAAIDQVLTEAKVTGRTLGKTQVKDAAWVATVAFTGNNLSSSSDFSDRAIWSVLEPTVENPRERMPDGYRIPDLEEFARVHRANLLRKALVILRWHAANGKPSAGGKKVGSFEQWASTVRDAVMHLTGHDVKTNGRDAAIADQESDELGTLLGGLSEYFEWRKSVGKSQPSFMVAELHADLNDPANSSAWSDLRLVVDSSSTLRQFNTAVGKMLTKYRGRVFEGMKLNVRTYNKKNYWRIDKIGDS